MLATFTNTACIHTVIEDDIHHLYFPESSRKAVDGFFDALDFVYDMYDTNPLPKGKRVLFLYEVEKNELPITYTFQTYRKWKPSRAVHHDSRIAVLNGTQALTPIVNLLLRTVPAGHLEARFFNRSDRPAAITWLQDRFYS